MKVPPCNPSCSLLPFLIGIANPIPASRLCGSPMNPDLTAQPDLFFAEGFLEDHAGNIIREPGSR